MLFCVTLSIYNSGNRHINWIELRLKCLYLLNQWMKHCKIWEISKKASWFNLVTNTLDNFVAISSNNVMIKLLLVFNNVHSFIFTEIEEKKIVTNFFLSNYAIRWFLGRKQIYNSSTKRACCKNVWKN